MKGPRHCVPGSTKAPFLPFREEVLAIISSSVDKSTAEYRANAKRMRSLVSELQARRAEAALGGSERSRSAMWTVGSFCHATVS